MIFHSVKYTLCSLLLNKGAHVFSADRSNDIVRIIKAENHDRKMIILADSRGGAVHYFKIVIKHLLEGYPVVFFSIGISFRIAVIHSVDHCRLENDIRLYLGSSESRSSIS